ncbi:hypothetical protein TNCV_3120411 [Trichonephila clavipes]|uniref:Uncharacterized protein n=1 Tax=Trichonephila clavipes TaxID=2585209 RepID=A0A8X6WB39_TRICX|nr:hypothetical protein TNCV_3120411 [Trichonephila clavipes]
MHAANVRLPQCAKHGWGHLDAVNIIWIHLKKGLLAIRAPRYLVTHTSEDIPVCVSASGVSAGNKPVFLAVIDIGPLRSSTAFHFTVLIPSIPYSTNRAAIL